MNVFTVLTDFKFEIGSALLNTERLQDAVGGLQGKVDDTLVSFQKLSMGLASSFGLTSFLGVMGAAVSAADKFHQSQLAFASIFASNKANLTGPVDTFAGRLQVASNIMDDIAMKAMEFGISGDSVTEMTKGLAAMLIPKGLAGDNLSTAIDMSRGLIKSAPILGVDSYEVQGQLMRALDGSASMGDTLFRRLVAETDLVKGLNGKPTEAFNRLNEAEKVRRLTESLLHFGKNTDEVKGQLDNFAGQMRRLKLLLSPLESATNIFRPLGDNIMKGLVKVLDGVFNVLNTHGRSIVQSISKIFGGAIENPQGLLELFMTLRETKANVDKTGSIFSMTGVIMGIGHMFKWLRPAGILAKLAHPWLMFIIPAVSLLTELFTRANPLLGRVLGTVALLGAVIGGLLYFGKLGMVVGGLASLAGGIIGPLLAIFGTLMLFSKAAAKAQIEDAKAMPAIIARSMEALAKLKGVMSVAFSPLVSIFDGLANMLTPLFAVSGFLDFLSKGFARLVDGLIAVVATLEACGAAIGTFFGEISEGRFWNLGGKSSDAFDRQLWQSWEHYQGNVGKPNGAGISNHTTNIGKVEIRNEFRDQMEPDRVAFTLKDQLLRAATNPTQARGRSHSFGGKR